MNDLAVVASALASGYLRLLASRAAETSPQRAPFGTATRQLQSRKTLELSTETRPDVDEEHDGGRPDAA